MTKSTILILLFFGLHQIGSTQNNSREYQIGINPDREKQLISNSEGKVSSQKSSIEFKRIDGKTVDLDMSIQMSKGKGKVGFVKFGVNENANQLFVNLIPTKSSPDSNITYSYELKNHQSLKLKFSEWSVIALSTPVKMNFGKKNSRLATGGNFGLLIGKSRGTTKFSYNNITGNHQINTKKTFGFYLGSDPVEFSYLDNSNEEQTVQTTLLSPGLGYLFSYQNFTIGGILGLDYALGKDRSHWDLQGSAWLGASIGYSLFSY